MLLASMACAIAARASVPEAGAEFSWIRLSGIDGRAGGIEVWLSSTGVVVLREVGAAQPERAARTENRWQGVTIPRVVVRVRGAVPAFLSASEGFGRSGIPGEPYFQIDLERADGSRAWRGKFVGDKRPGVDELEAELRAIAREIRAISEPQRLIYDPRWRP